MKRSLFLPVIFITLVFTSLLSAQVTPTPPSPLTAQDRVRLERLEKKIDQISRFDWKLFLGLIVPIFAAGLVGYFKTQKDLAKNLAVIQNTMLNMQQDIAQVRADQQRNNQQIDFIKTEISQIRTDVQLLQKDVYYLKEEIVQIRVELNEINQRIDDGLKEVNVRIGLVRDELTNKIETGLKETNQRIDSIKEELDANIRSDLKLLQNNVQHMQEDIAQIRIDQRQTNQQIDSIRTNVSKLEVGLTELKGDVRLIVEREGQSA